MPEDNREHSLQDLFSQAGGEEGAAHRASRRARPEQGVPAPESPVPLMQLDSLEIENLWSYRRAQVSFPPGITVIAGPNGSGKSSLLESIFFALYGSKAGPAMDRALADVLRIGADRGAVCLRFRYGGRGYTAQMALRRRGDSAVSEKEDCRLTREDGEEWVGVETVAQAVEGLFGMNRDDFANCVYVRQGEIDRLIRAGEEERRGMIDRLLRLEKLDRYASRAREGGRRAINRRREVLERLLREFRRDVEALEAKGLAELRAQVEREIQAEQDDLVTVEERISKAEELQYRLRQSLERMEEQAREVRERAQEIRRKEKQLEQHERRERELKGDHERLRKRYKELESRLSRGLSDLAIPQQPVIGSFQTASSWEELSTLPEALERTQEEQDQLHECIQKEQSEVNAKILEASKARERVLTKLTEEKTRMQHLESELDEMRALIAAGRCPTCRQPVDEGTLGPELEERQAKLEKLKAEIQPQEAKFQLLTAKVEELKEHGERRGKELSQAAGALQIRRSRLEELKELALTLLHVKEQGLERVKRRSELSEAIEPLREEIAELKAKLAQRQEQLRDPAELTRRSEQVAEKLKELGTQKRSVQDAIGALHRELGTIKSQLERLKNLKRSQAETEEELRRVEALRDELLGLTEFYGALKRELRTRNIEALEHYFNRFFRLMDPGTSYSRVRVTSDYQITLELVDGRAIRPELLSGGERALVNIALRTAIHQVLSRATARMPLLLDEPTIYLDREHVGRLQFLLEELGDRIGQVVFVSHELGLVEGADHQYLTEKTPDNASRVERVR